MELLVLAVLTWIAATWVWKQGHLLAALILVASGAFNFTLFLDVILNIIIRYGD